MEFGKTMSGLTHSEAEISRRDHGSNEISQKRRNTFLRQFLSNFGDPIIRILLIALAVNLVYLFRDFDWYESAGIAVAILLAVFVSTLSEYGSESAFEKLQQDAAKIKCRVRRNDKIIELPIGQVVVGDVILLQAGERIPADGRLTQGSLSVDQAALNGESKEAQKTPIEDYSKGTDFFLQNKQAKGGSEFLLPNKLFRGSVVCSGEGIMLVEGVGDKTFYGSLAAEIQEDTIESPLKSKLRHLAKIISRFGYAAALFLTLANIFNSIVIANNFDIILIQEYLSDTSRVVGHIIEATILGITVVVMAVPEGLPMMITVVLSSNMKRMLKDNVLVRKLVGIETSGGINILFTDKTGTLTKGRLDVVTFIDGAGGEYNAMAALRRHPKLAEFVGLNCLYNNGAQMNPKNIPIGGNSTDRALLRFIKREIRGMPEFTKGDWIPFNSEDKMSVCEIKNAGGSLYLIKGAPERLLPHCADCYDKKGRKTAFKSKAGFTRRMGELTDQSIRLLALCTSDGPVNPKNLGGLTLVGLIGIQDELRKEVPAAIEQVTAAGVQVVMITGDNKDTAVAVAKKSGLIKAGEDNAVMTSAELNGIDDEELKQRLSKIRVIARALPSDKSRLVRISQEMGLVAGMTGDGVNDAPALKRADVGFAMGSGTEVAKESGDIVILDNNFASIVKAILYGRTIFKNIRKFIIFQLTVNFCAVGISVVGPLIGVKTPVTVIQMLWINMIMDTLAGLAFAGEPPLDEYMKESPLRRDEKIINRQMYGQIIFTGIYTTVMFIVFLKLPPIRDIFGPELMTGFFALFIFAGIFNSFNARTRRVNILSDVLRNKAFLMIMGVVFIIQLGLIYYGGTVFRTSGLSGRELGYVMLLASSVIIADVVRKIIVKSRRVQLTMDN